MWDSGTLGLVAARVRGEGRRAGSLACLAGADAAVLLRRLPPGPPAPRARARRESHQRTGGGGGGGACARGRTRRRVGVRQGWKWRILAGGGLRKRTTLKTSDGPHAGAIATCPELRPCGVGPSSVPRPASGSGNDFAGNNVIIATTLFCSWARLSSFDKSSTPPSISLQSLDMHTVPSSPCEGQFASSSPKADSMICNSSFLHRGHHLHALKVRTKTFQGSSLCSPSYKAPLFPFLGCSEFLQLLLFCSFLLRFSLLGETLLFIKIFFLFVYFFRFYLAGNQSFDSFFCPSTNRESRKGKIRLRPRPNVYWNNKKLVAYQRRKLAP